MIDDQLIKTYSISNSFLRDSETYHKSILKTSRAKLSRPMYNWSRVRVFAFTIGVFLSIQKELKTFGTSKNQETIQSLKSIKDEKAKFLVFHPKGRFKLLWNLMITFLLFYTASVLPYRVCFNLLQNREWVLADLLVDCLFFIDIIINFNTGIISVSGKLTYSRTLIAKSYIKSWFLLDLISCLPLDYVFSSQKQTTIFNKFLRILKVTRMYRIIKILRLLKLMRFFRSQFVQTLSHDQFFQSRIKRTFTFLVAICFFVHITGCIWFYVSSADELNENSWMLKYSMLEKPNTEIYIACIYFVFTTFTTVGYGDIVPSTISEKIFTMALMGFGVGLYSYMISALSSSISKRDEVIESLKARNKRLKSLFREINLPEKTILKVKQQLHLNMEKGYADLVDIDNLLTELPSHIRNLILSHYNQKYVEGIHFFKDKPSTLVNGMVQYIHVSCYILKDVLYEKNDPAEEVYFIKSGKVLLKNEAGLAFWVYPQGNYFGDIEVLLGGHRVTTAAIGTGEAEIYSINTRNFLEILRDYDLVYLQIKSLAEVRRGKLFEALREIEGNMNTCTFDSEEIEDNTLIEDEVETSTMNRKDTGVQFSLKNDTPIKRKNRKLWGTVIFGRNLLKDRKKKSKTIVLIDGRTRHSSLEGIKRLESKKRVNSIKKLSFPQMKYKPKKRKTFEWTKGLDEICCLYGSNYDIGIDERSSNANIDDHHFIIGPRRVEESVENKVFFR